MIYKLTKSVWWCAAESLYETYSDVKCVLAVGGNLENLPLSAGPLGVPERIPYFRVAQPDNELVTEEYHHILKSIIHLIHQCKLLPVIVHCRAGQMRSPAAAILVANLIDGVEISELIQMAKRLRPDIMYQPTGDVMLYPKSLLSPHLPEKKD